MPRSPGGSKLGPPSIARNLTLSLMLTVICVSLLVTTLFTMHQMHKDKAELLEVADEIADLAAQSLSLPLWFLHTDTITEIGRAYSVNRLVVALKISDMQNTPLYDFNEKGGTDNGIVRTRDITYNSEQIGHLEITVTTHSLQTKKNRLFFLGALDTTLASLALLLITGASLRVFLNRPVKRLQALVEQYAGGDLVPHETSPPQEFLELDRTFRSMAQRIRRQVDELAQAESSYRSLFQNAMEGMYRVSLEGKLLMVNPSMASMLGYSSPEELLDSARDVRRSLYVDPDERDRFLEIIHEKGQVVNFETVFRKKNGQFLWVRLGAVVINEEGEIQGYCEDVTQQVEARQALVAAKEEAEAASQLKSDFLSMVSHELRTPLTSVVGFSKLIEKRLLQVLELESRSSELKRSKNLSQIVDQLKIIISEGERLTRLINNVLDLAKLEAGRLDLSLQTCAVQELVDRALKATRALFNEKGLQSSLDIPPDLPPVSCDPDRVHQVLINLLSNAIRVTPQGDITCSARYEAGYVVLSVRDQGMGIDPDQAHSVFDKFRQLGDTIDDPCAGTGLGLAICHQIVAQHGGSIWFENNPEGGCEFFFSLLVSEPEDPAAS